MPASRRATSGSRRRSPARRRSRRGRSSRRARCARSSSPSRRPRSRRTTCTGAARSCSSPGPRSSAGLAAAEPLRIICGPTGAGKSALAMALARVHAATIISADSRQIYRGFDIGTAKPTPRERREVPHRGIDVCDPAERYSAAKWADGARGWIDESHAAGRVPLVVGGAGLYLRALTAPLFDEPPLDPAHRAALETALAAYSVSELRRWCMELDPPRAHLGRTQL